MIFSPLHNNIVYRKQLFFEKHGLKKVTTTSSHQNVELAQILLCRGINKKTP